MAATSLKLPDDLKQRITDLVEGTGQTAHGFMVEAIEQAAERAVLRRRFSAAALEAEADALRTGKAYAACCRRRTRRESLQPPSAKRSA